MRWRRLLLVTLSALVHTAASLRPTSLPLVSTSETWAVGTAPAVRGDRTTRALASRESVNRREDAFECVGGLHIAISTVQLADGDALMRLGLSSLVEGERDRAVELFERALAINASLASGHEHELALAYHYAHDFAAAERYYRRVADVSSAAFHFDFGVTLERRGKILEAADEYNRALAIDPSLAEAWLNIAALHHLHGDVNASIRPYMRVINLPTASPGLRLMAMTNVGVAYELMGRVRSAMLWYGHALELLLSVPFRSEIESIASKATLLAHHERAKKAAADWSGGESGFDELWRLVRIHMLAIGRPSALLPFDTLLYPMTPSERKWVAIVHSSQFDALHIGRGTTTSASHHYQLSHLESSRLHVGFVSYDFSDHPTTHLMEGVFAFVNRSRSKLIAFGYGRDDGSESRQRIVSTADKFVNLAAESFEDSASVIRHERVHILMDAQGHTRGGRMKIAGLRPAPIIVNYLVYPGTSGAAFIDYIICDAFVTPPAELAGAFTEKLVLLPNSYQVNYYDAVGVHQRSKLWELPSPADLADRHSRLHLDADIDPNAFVFVNFNKIDKLESQVFAVWMAIMHRVPRSVLLLLDPSRSDASTETSEEAKENLFREARALGISASRIQFLTRVPKAQHLRRHRIGGLFLDTLTYGAHSTATDALYAGLPVLTLAGDSFASRVAVSLLANSDTPELIAYSCREYEDLAVYLATHPRTLDAVKRRLRASSSAPPALFRTREHSQDLEASWQAMFDVYSLTNRSWHIHVGSHTVTAELAQG